MAVAGDHASIANRIEVLLHEVATAPTVQRARVNADDLARTLVELYGSALERILDIVHENAADRADSIFAALCEDRFVESLLVLHDLHPLTLEDRVAAALDTVRPYLASHQGGVEVVAVADGVAHLRLEGTCDGCPSSAATMTLAVERAILDRIHEVTEVRVVNVTPAPLSGETSRAATLRIESDWIVLDGVPLLQRDGFARLEIAATPVILFVQGDEYFAYRDRCPACLEAFADARFVFPVLHCSGCESGYDVARAGRSDTNESFYAEPFPLMRDGARVRVAIPVGA